MDKIMYDVTVKLIGPIRPVGDTNEDIRRFDNLETTINLVDKLISDIYNVSLNKNRHEHSVAKAGKRANEFLNSLADYSKDNNKGTTMSEQHPVQISGPPHAARKISSDVTWRAYEVYCHIYSPQPAMMKDGCRGGFSAGELICFLYARSFPEAEWKSRFSEAISSVENF